MRPAPADGGSDLSMLSLKLAFRNLMGAGLRTWLNVIVLSVAYVVIIWMQGFLQGWNAQARSDTINWEIGGGQIWHQEYDPYDSFTFDDSHGPAPAALLDNLPSEDAAPLLVSRASIYPDGRIQNVVLKGIEPGQTVLKLPTSALQDEMEDIPVLIGTRMAQSASLRQGDYVTLRWRDVNGMFDAASAVIVQIMKTNVPAVDNGILWVSLDRMREMLQLPGESTLFVLRDGAAPPAFSEGWVFRDQGFLLQDITDVIKVKSVSAYIMYAVLLSLALLAIFDTQVFAIFRRRREIGTLMALGMTRGGVIALFTVEGAMHGILAALAAAVYGIPLLRWQMSAGVTMPAIVDDFGLAISEKMFPLYSVGLVAGTVFFVLLAVTAVSFIPTRTITRLNPTEAIKGKLS